MKVLCCCMAIFCWLGFTNAWAAEETSNNVLDKRIIFYGGAQLYQVVGEFSSARDGRPDVSVDLDDLGLDESTVNLAAGAIFNFWKSRLTLRFDYFGYHDDGTKSAEFEFDFDDVTFPVGARLDTNLDLDLYVTNLSFNFFRSDRARFGVGLGVHAADIDIGISGTVRLGNTATNIGSASADFIAPLPNLYVTGAYAFTEKFLLRYGGGGMSLSLGDWEGSLYFIKAFLEYWPFKYAGIGAGYRYLAADVKYDNGKREEKYDFALPGPVLYVTVGF